MALPTRWSADPDPGITRYTVGDLGPRGTHIIIACPHGRGADVSLAVNGVIAPSSSDIGFKAAGRNIRDAEQRQRADGDQDQDNAAAFGRAVARDPRGQHAAGQLHQRRHCSLPLTGSARALPAAPCPVDYRKGKLNLDI